MSYVQVTFGMPLPDGISQKQAFDEIQTRLFGLSIRGLELKEVPERPMSAHDAHPAVCEPTAESLSRALEGTLGAIQHVYEMGMAQADVRREMGL